MRAAGIALLAVIMAGPAFGQNISNSTPTEPNRFAGGGHKYVECLQTLQDVKQNLQVSCYVTGTMARFGDVTGKTGVCDNESFNARAKECFSGFVAKSAYLGNEGQVCAALLFDVRPSDMAPPNQWLRRLHSKEVPCEGQPKPAVSPRDKGDVAAMVFKRVLEQTSRSACEFKSKSLANVEGTCFVRASPDKSGKLTAGVSSTCSEPALAEAAESCTKTLRVKSEERASAPGPFCVRVHHVGKDRLPKDVYSLPYGGAGEMEFCPDGFFQ